jgi:adenylate cyclase
MAQEPVFELIEQTVLGEGPRYTPGQVYGRTGTPEDVARQLWRAMGFPHIPPDEAPLTQRDVEALSEVQALLDAGVDLELAIRHARVMSQALATVAAAQVETLETGSGHEVSAIMGTFAGETETVLGRLDRLLAYLYRRHLAAALERSALVSDDGEGAQPTLVVGFADLAGFTATSRRISAREVADLVELFASSAADVVAECGGRVIKLVGDEVLFTVDEPAAGAEAALAVTEAAERLEDRLPVHAGLALGPVHQHLGDVFGTTVNRASRLTDAARPGTVLVDEAVHDGLGDDPRFTLRRVHLRPLKGLGVVRPYALRRGG